MLEALSQPLEKRDDSIGLNWIARRVTVNEAERSMVKSQCENETHCPIFLTNDK